MHQESYGENRKDTALNNKMSETYNFILPLYYNL